MKAFDGIGLAAVVALSATAVVVTSPGNVSATTTGLTYGLGANALEYEFGEQGNELLLASMLNAFGTHEQPKLPETADYAALGIEGPAELAMGREAFRRKCQHCHGTNGGADGPTAQYLYPVPRNFRGNEQGKGLIKFTSTPRTSPPVRDDIRRVLRNGVAYSAMPAFTTESDAEIDALVSYVQMMLLRGETEAQLAYTLDDEGLFEDEDYTAEELVEEIESYMADEYEAVQGAWISAEDEVINPPVPRTPSSPDSIARGRELFLSATTECSACHGEAGDGKGPNVWTEEEGYKLVDEWGNEVRPADLRPGFYRGGNRPLDLYRRIDQGIKGTPMPAFSDSLTPEQIWDLVNYILYLPYSPEARS